jgi:hypothetical protein
MGPAQDWTILNSPMFKIEHNRIEPRRSLVVPLKKWKFQVIGIKLSSPASIGFEASVG